MNPLNSILQAAQKLFIRYGVRGVSMDEIARETGKSKKTLYELISDKRALVHSVIQNFIKAEEKFCLKCISDHDNAIDQILSISNHISKTLRNINPATIQDIRKLYPESWQVFNEHRTGFVYNTMEKNIQLGQKQGFYRTEANPRIIAILYAELIEVIVEGNDYLSADHNFREIYREAVNYHLHGILSERGKEYLQSIENQNLK